MIAPSRRLRDRNSRGCRDFLCGPGRSGRRRLGLRLGAVGLAALLLAGCGGAPDAPVPPDAPVASDVPSPSITVVTVPGLTSSALDRSGTGAARDDVIPDTADTSEAATEDAARTGPDPATADAMVTSDEDATEPASQPVSSRSPVPPREPTAATSPAASTTPAAEPTTVAVDLASCTGCQVIGVAAAVQPGLAASLATAPQGAVLLATRADGTVAGVSNVPYGVTFPAPAGGVLPCDRSGRCFVTADQSRGNAVISVFQLAADGSWRDVTASGGFTSVTATALVRDVDVDGLLDVAVQADAGGTLRWVVYGWSGDRFVTMGCVVSAAGLDDAGVSLTACS